MKVSILLALAFVVFSMPSAANADVLEATQPHPCQPHQEPWIEVLYKRNQIKFWCGFSLYKEDSVGLGKLGWETRPGRYQVHWIVERPAFENFFSGEVDSSPNNPLGSVFIAVYYDSERRFWVGFHPTSDLDSVGKRKSHGCMRLFESTAQELARFAVKDMLVWINDGDPFDPSLLR